MTLNICALKEEALCALFKASIKVFAPFSQCIKQQESVQIKPLDGVIEQFY